MNGFDISMRDTLQMAWLATDSSVARSNSETMSISIVAIKVIANPLFRYFCHIYLAYADDMLPRLPFYDLLECLASKAHQPSQHCRSALFCSRMNFGKIQRDSSVSLMLTNRNDLHMDIWPSRQDGKRIT